MGANEAQSRKNEYSSYGILVDDPAQSPVLGFGDYADAFAEIVRGSPPRFAIGIFGGWGSGKTTLMRAICSRIEGYDDVIPVWFNAWRYEREEQLIIPLLDVLRETLLRWAEEHDPGEASSRTVTTRAREAAAAMGAAARAIGRGLTLSARVPGGFAEASLDLEKILSSKAAMQAVDEPASAYHASFKSMADAVSGFISAGGGPAGNPEGDPQRRIVVFIDDLDRCLPPNALSVLESMKLFFDLDGFVFVAGLDQTVIERAVEDRYKEDPERARYYGASSEEPSAAVIGARPGAGSITGRDDIKKIFQVPFGLPSVDRTQLQDLVNALLGTQSVTPVQSNDLHGRIVEHLQYYSDGGTINAREVKRLINAYTLQAKLLSLKLGEVDLDTILALQVMAFRPDWERIWERLVADPEGFVSRVQHGLALRGNEAVRVDGQPLPPRLVDYLDKGPGKRLLANQKLKAYLSSSQSSHGADPTILQAQAVVDELRRFVRGLDAGKPNITQWATALQIKLSGWKAVVSGATWALDLMPLITHLESSVVALTEMPSGTGDAGMDIGEINEWIEGFTAQLDRLDNDLRDLRERYSLTSS